ncbi:MAG: hypothetical protein MJZ11_08390 [Lachnospiraceae bacterium]|nr:hypothetical protein [Lachnospiraceae bacterium]
MFEVVNVFLADEKVLKSKIREKKIKDTCPDAEVRFANNTGRYYICLGEYQTLDLAQRKAKEFRKKGIIAGIRNDEK